MMTWSQTELQKINPIFVSDSVHMEYGRETNRRREGRKKKRKGKKKYKGDFTSQTKGKDTPVDSHRKD